MDRGAGRVRGCHRRGDAPGARDPATRSDHGQAVLITQSIADIEALTNTPRPLDSLTDTFAGIVAHEQKSPDSRDWLARLMGARE
jgi:hypothetical protein